MGEQVARNLAYGAALILGLVFLAAAELTYINGIAAVIIMVSGAFTALAFSIVARRGGVVANGDDTVELKGPAGLSAKIPARRLLGENSLLLIFCCVLAYFGYVHHTSNEEALKRVYEATVENTYVLSLSQADREALKIAMPESLRRKIRRDP